MDVFSGGSRVGIWRNWQKAWSQHRWAGCSSCWSLWLQINFSWVLILSLAWGSLRWCPRVSLEFDNGRRSGRTSREPWNCLQMLTCSSLGYIKRAVNIHHFLWNSLCLVLNGTVPTSYPFPSPISTFHRCCNCANMAPQNLILFPIENAKKYFNLCIRFSWNAQNMIY